MSKNKFNEALKAWKEFLKNPTEAALAQLKTAMKNAGTNYKKIEGMKKDFATKYIHGNPKNIAVELAKDYPSKKQGTKADNPSPPHKTTDVVSQEEFATVEE